MVQQVCGNYENDRCHAKGGERCDVQGCPFLSADPARRGGTAPTRGLDAVDRRTLVLGGATAAAAAVVGGVVAGTAAGLGRIVGGAAAPGDQSVALAPPPHATGASGSGPTTTAPGPAATSTAPTGNQIGAASQVPVGGAASFTDPTTGAPGLVLQLSKGRFVAYDAVCPHAGCTVGYSAAANLIVCPCHGSEFDPRSGAVVSPPAQHGLRSIGVGVDANGELFVND